MKVDNFDSKKVAAVLVAISCCAVALMLTWQLSQRLDQTILAALIIVVMTEFAVMTPRASIALTWVYLALNGDLRKLLMYTVGRTDNDPLLLVAPAVMAVLVFSLVFNNQIQSNSRLSRMMIWFSILMVLQALNPYQGGIMIGLAGLFLFLCPMSWFWVGQYYGTEEFLKKMLLRVFVPMALVASFYTFYQAAYGLFDFQMYWLIQTKMIDLNLGNTPRPSAFFPAPSEMGMYAATAAIIMWASFLCHRNRKWTWIIPILAAACFLQGNRGNVVIMLFVGCLMWALTGTNSRTWAVRLAIAVAIGFGGLLYSLSQIGDADSSSSISPILQHHAKGILNPGDSSLQGHVVMMFSGIFMGTVQNPFGWGIGSTTLAAARANTMVAEMEVDFTNIFLSMGVVGGVLYLCIIGSIMKRAFNFWRAQRSFIAMAILGICLVQFTNYLRGLHYSLVILVWFTFGALENLTSQQSTSSAELPNLSLMRRRNRKMVVAP